jgi:hypothetical protein
MRDIAQKLHGVALLLKRVCNGICAAKEVDLSSAQLYRLACCGAFNKLPFDADTGPGGNMFEDLIRNGTGIDDNLEIGKTTAIIQLNKVNALAVSPGLNPPVRYDGSTSRAGEQVFNVATLFDHVQTTLNLECTATLKAALTHSTALLSSMDFRLNPVEALKQVSIWVVFRLNRSANLAPVSWQRRPGAD